MEWSRRLFDSRLYLDVSDQVKLTIGGDGGRHGRDKGADRRSGRPNGAYITFDISKGRDDERDNDLEAVVSDSTTVICGTDPSVMTRRVNEELLAKIKEMAVKELRQSIAELEERLTVAEAGNEPVDTTTPCGEALESLLQKLEHARLEQKWVTVEYANGFSHTGTIEVIAPDEEDGPDGIHFDDNCYVPLSSITHVEVLAVVDAPDEPKDAHIEASAIWDKLDAAMEARREVQVEFDTNYTKGTLTGNVKNLYRSHATIGEIGVYFADMTRVDDVSVHHLAGQPEDDNDDGEPAPAPKWTYAETVTGGGWRIYEDNPVQEYIGEVSTEEYAQVIIDGHNRGIAEQPDEPEDIAAQRWVWRPVGAGEGLVRIDEDAALSYVDSPAQKKLQAAAPELADKARALINKSQSYKIADALKGDWIDLMGLLVHLGIPGLQAMTFVPTDSNLDDINTKTMSL